VPLRFAKPVTVNILTPPELLSGAADLPGRLFLSRSSR